MRAAAEFLARAAGDASRRLGRGGGTTVPGRILLRLRPNALAELAGDLAGPRIAISATNGKTTTARLIVGGLDAAGQTVVANTAGANLMTGVTAALLDAGRDARRRSAAVLEVDEAALPEVAGQTAPDVLVLINLFRDQLDRYGELETLIATWRTLLEALPSTTTLVLNADDPAISSLATDRHRVVWFGIDDPAVARDALAHAADSTTCRTCATALHYDQVTLGHLGHWSCPEGHERRPTPEIAVESISPRGLDGQQVVLRSPAGPVTLDLALAGVHNAYNAAAATAALLAADVARSAVTAGLGATDAAFGRGEQVTIDGRRLVMMLAKNPTGVNANIGTILSTADPDRPLHLLALLNDRTADGQDVSWIWDVDYEPLLERLDRITFAGDRSRDLALRFRYAGLDGARSTVVPDPGAALDHALSSVDDGATLFALPTYTAMLDLREVLTARGVTHAFWTDR